MKFFLLQAALCLSLAQCFSPSLAPKGCGFSARGRGVAAAPAAVGLAAGAGNLARGWPTSTTTLKMAAEKFDTIVIPPDFKLGAGFILGGAAVAGGLHNTGVGLPLLVIGAFLTLQATRVRFEFDDTSMEVKLGGGNADGELQDSGENFAVGGANRWRYDTFTKWRVLPFRALPILVYFSETQTAPQGQPHFFPFIMDPGLLIKTLEERVPKSASD